MHRGMPVDCIYEGRSDFFTLHPANATTVAPEAGCPVERLYEGRCPRQWTLVHADQRGLLH